MTRVELHGVSKRFGETTVVANLDLAIEPGELLVLVGPSGGGKSTVLRLLAGLETLDAGRILFDGEPVHHLPPGRRDVAMVFQSYALYPHMTVFENMAFGLRRGGILGLRRRRQGRRAIRERVVETAQALRIHDLLQRKPAQLSGGQRQRVAMGRAMVRNPRLFLFDEPLSNLDAGLRLELRAEIAELQRRLGATTLHVTHDQAEAMTLAHRIAVVNAGRIEQIGDPMTLYHRPANRFVAGFIGSPPMNFLPATVGSPTPGPAGQTNPTTTLLLPAGDAIALPRTLTGLSPGDPLTLGVRPDRLIPADPGQEHLTGRLFLVEPLGTHMNLHMRAADGSPFVARTPPGPAGESGALGAIRRWRLPLDSLYLFDESGSVIIN